MASSGQFGEYARAALRLSLEYLGFIEAAQESDDIEKSEVMANVRATFDTVLTALPIIIFELFLVRFFHP